MPVKHRPKHTRKLSALLNSSDFLDSVPGAVKPEKRAFSQLRELTLTEGCDSFIDQIHPDEISVNIWQFLFSKWLKSDLSLPRVGAYALPVIVRPPYIE